MIKITTFTHKQPNAKKDYKLAYDLVNSLSVGSSQTVTPDNDKAFRKYVYDLSLKQGKDFATRKRGQGTRQITRLS